MSRRPPEADLRCSVKMRDGSLCRNKAEIYFWSRGVCRDCFERMQTKTLDEFQVALGMVPDTAAVYTNVWHDLQPNKKSPPMQRETALQEAAVVAKVGNRIIDVYRKCGQGTPWEFVTTIYPPG